MEFTFDLRRLLRPDSNGFAVIQPTRAMATNREVCEVIDRMGRASSTAQGLKTVITTSSRFFASSDNLLFLLVEGNSALGILKTGSRKLFHTDQLGRIHEISPVCVLDFYVHESKQRTGFGKVLYENMLAYLQISPSQLAIDRPSIKFISFMRRHYGLSNFVPQNNNFVVYNDYFKKPSERTDRRPPTETPELRALDDRILGTDFRTSRRDEMPSREYMPTYPKPVYSPPQTTTSYANAFQEPRPEEFNLTRPILSRTATREIHQDVALK